MKACLLPAAALLAASPLPAWAGPLQWQPVQAVDDPLAWEPVPADAVALQEFSPALPDQLQKPQTLEEAQALLEQFSPLASDYPPLLRLGPAVPTANQLKQEEGQFSAFTLSPFDGGEASGTGNQNYAAQLDYGLSETWQVSGFYSQADDPLYAAISGRSIQPANFWESYGGALQWQLLNHQAWKLSLSGSLEGWNVGSGGCDSFRCKGQNDASPNIFNDSGSRVFTRNIVGSVALPLSWQASQQWQLSFAPGVSFLPASQGGDQGGAGSFYGNNAFVSGGASWRPSRHWSVFGSALQPLGPGSNSFNGNLQFSRVPILAGGVNWALNPRIALEGLLTNGFGATPATALLALPSSNRLGYMARFNYTPSEADTPQPKLGSRLESIALGGITVNTALVPPDGTNELWANADSEGNVFGYIGTSISNIFQLDLFRSGVFNNVAPTSALARTYASDGGWNWRAGGKAVAFSPLRGAPFWGGGRISLGRNNDPSSYQGYVFAETMATWEATPWLALNLNPKVAWSGVGVPWGFGLGANIQLGPRWQLIPEVNVVASDTSESNGTLGLRWVASDSVKVDVYVSNAAGVLDMGQLLASGQGRVGGRLIFSF